MLWQNRGMWSRRNSVCSESRPKAFDMSSGIPKLPITSRSVDNIYNRVLCCKSISINYKMHGWFLYWQHATGWVWWKSGLRAVAMWSSSSFTKRCDRHRQMGGWTDGRMHARTDGQTERQTERQTVIFFKGNPFENVICKMLAIFFRPKYRLIWCLFFVKGVSSTKAKKRNSAHFKIS